MLAEAEQIAARIEAYKIADKQRSRLVGRVDMKLSKTKKSKVNPQFRLRCYQKPYPHLQKRSKILVSEIVMAQIIVHFITKSRQAGTSITIRITIEIRDFRGHIKTTRISKMTMVGLDLMVGTGEITPIKQTRAAKGDKIPQMSKI